MLAWLANGKVYGRGARRLLLALRLSHSLIGALLNSLAILLLLAIQWQAFARQFSSRPAIWKGRQYPA